MSDLHDPGADLPEATDAEQAASALLDGEATDAERARADEAAVLEARERFARVAAAVAEPGAVDAPARERAIAAALAAGASMATAPVDELGERRRRGRLGLRIAGIAAALLAVVAIGGVLAGGGSNDSDDAATEALDEPADSSAAGSAADDGTAEGTDSFETSLALTDLGAYDDVDTLVAAAADADTSRSSGDEAGADADATVLGESAPAAGGEAPTTAAGSFGCTPPTPPPGEVTTTATATLEGRPVQVLVVDGDAGQVVQIYDFETCELIHEGPPT